MTSSERPLPLIDNILEDDEPLPLQDLINAVKPIETASDLQSDLIGRAELIAENMQKAVGNKIPSAVLPVAV